MSKFGFRHIIVIWISSLFMIGCANSDFTGVADSAKKAGKKTGDATGDDKEGNDGNDGNGESDGDITTDPTSGGKSGGEKDGAIGNGGIEGSDNGADDLGIDGADSGADGGEPLITDDEIKKRKTECWFAVSGGWVGVNNSNGSVFPNTKSGSPIGQLEKFDTVGGVFLAARTEPYKKGEGAIDIAIQQTFDGIAVAPGMNVKIMNAQGAVTYEGKGPIVGISQERAANHDKVKSDILANAANPQWMTDYVKDKGALLITPLWSANSVEVSAIKGGRCDVFKE